MECPAHFQVSLDPYRKESAKILSIFKEMVPEGEVGGYHHVQHEVAQLKVLAEKASIDEAYMDLTPMVISRLLERFPHLATVPEDAKDGLETALPDPPHLPWTTSVNLLPTDTGASLAAEGEECTSDDEEPPKEDAATWSDWALFLGSEIMANVRAEIWDRLHYTCSAGIAHNKAMAKVR